MNIFDSTFSTLALLKPGEPPIPEGLPWGQPGESVLSGWQPCYWTGRYAQAYSDADIAEWRKLVGPNRLGIVDFEKCLETVSDAKITHIAKLASAGGRRIATFGLYPGLFKTRYRDGRKKGNLSNHELASKRVLIDDMILRRIDIMAPALNCMAYLTVEIQVDNFMEHESLYLDGYSRWSEIFEVRFPKIPRLAWIAGYCSKTETPMPPEVCRRYLERVKERGDDCLCWGYYNLNQNFYEASMAFV